MPASVDHFEIDTPTGLTRLPVELKLVPAARRMKLSVRGAGKIRLTFPRGTRRASLAHFIREQSAWLLNALANVSPAPTIVAHLEKFPWVSVAGKLCTLEISETPARAFSVFREGEELVIFRHRAGENHEPDLHNLLRGLAAKTLPARVAFLAGGIAISFKRVSVRNQHGRWGSCSGNSTISLNWRLILLPPVLQDYVILHELAHTREMNHSEKFWQQLAQWDPDWKKNDRALTKQWGKLMELGRE